MMVECPIEESQDRAPDPCDYMKSSKPMALGGFPEDLNGGLDAIECGRDFIEIAWRCLLVPLSLDQQYGSPYPARECDRRSRSQMFPAECPVYKSAPGRSAPHSVESCSKELQVVVPVE